MSARYACCARDRARTPRGEGAGPIPHHDARSATLGLTVLGLGAATAALDTSVNVAFPALSQALALPVSAIQWIVVSYMLSFGALMLICGRLGDRFGHLRVFRAGLVVSAGAFALCTLAPNLEVLVAARVLQGAGAAASISCAPALATFLFPEPQRLRALGLYGALFAVAAAIGPMIGGPLVDAFGWRGVFGIRVPLACIALILASRLVERPQARKPFHARAAVLLTVAVATFLAALNSLQWASARLATFAMCGVGCIALAGFIRLQRGKADPFLPRAAFAEPRLLALNLLNLVVAAAAFSVLMLVPYELAAQGMAATSAGVVLAVSSSATSVASLAAPRLAQKVGQRFGPASLILAGLALTILGLAAIGFWTPGTPLGLRILALGAQGFGVGLFTVAYMDAVTGSLPVEDRGLAGGIATATRTFGIVAGASLFSAIFAAHATGTGAATADGFTTAFTQSFQIAASLLFTASVLLLAWHRYAGPRHRRAG